MRRRLAAAFSAAFAAALAVALVAAAAFTAAAPAAAAEPPIELRAELAPDPVALDELAELHLTVESSGLGLPRIDPGFLLENFEGVGGPSRSQSTSWVNGQSSSRLELTWRLRPLALGTARVHAFRVALGNEVRSLADLAVAVVEKAPPGRAPRPGAAPADPLARLFEDDPFGLFPRRRHDEPLAQPKLAVRSLLAPATAWVGEQVSWTLALDTQTDISGFRPRELPEFAGFWSHELELPERPRPEWIEVDGERYGRVAMMARALFPLRAGELQIEGITVDVQARMADAGWIGGLRRDQPVTLTARPVTLAVRKLPPPPASFSGVVGAVTLAASVDPPRIDVGQATTVLLRATTSGNPQGAALPALRLPAGLRSFPPAANSKERLVGGRLESEVEWRFVVLADRAGEYTLPALEWIYFDPAQRRYATASTGALGLVVGVGHAARSAPPSPPAAVAEGDAAAASGPTPSTAQRWMAPALAAAGLAALAALFAWRRRRAPSQLAQLRSALDAARRAASPRDAAKATEAAWRHLLDERYGLQRGTPAAQWPESLARAGWRRERAAELQQLFEEIHLLEFAPELADAEALRRDIDRRSRELARRLR